MSHDNPFRHLGDLLAQSARLDELSRRPLQELIRLDDERHSLLRLALNEHAKEWSTQAQIITREAERLPEALAKLTDDFAQRWYEQSKFSQLRSLSAAPSTPLAADPIAAALEAARGRQEIQLDDPLLALQEALQIKALNTDSANQSMPFLKLDEHVHMLRGTLADEAVASALGTFSEVISRFDTSKDAVTAELLSEISRLAGGMSLPHLQAVASEWTTLAQTVDLASLPLLHSTLTAISDIARQPGLGSFASLVARWEQVVEVERTQHEGESLSTFMIAFLLNLLFFLLGLAAQNSTSKETADQLNRLERSQSSVAVKLDDIEVHTEELAAIRQILDELVETEKAGADPADSAYVRVAKVDIPLLSSVSPDANVVSVIPLGARVGVIDEAESYCRVRYLVSNTGQHLEGWVPEGLLEAVPEREARR